ncbi:hypothetical protein ASG37_05055 [Sphingomonas sp. Leaf407]|nr:hypothetical protein ASG37_05055 [Sphingomonas sp. Leaf407]
MLSHSTGRRLARASAALAGFAIGAVLLDRAAIAAVAACAAFVLLLTLVLHLVRQPKGNR